MSKNNFLEIASEIAERYISVHPPESHRWDWGESVLMFGLIELYKITKKRNFLEFVKKWMDFHFEKGYKLKEVNSCSPAISALDLYKILNEPKYLEICKEILSYLKNGVIKTKDGGICHIGYPGYKYTSLWVDSLFLFGIFLGRYSETTGQKNEIDEFGKQIKIFSNKLESKGFFLHTWGWIDVNQQPDIFWARGNAWVTVALAEYIRIRKLRNESDEFVEQLFIQHKDAILSCQDQSTGLWWTVLNKPGETYLETSASALFAYGFAVGYNNGFLNESIKKSILKSIEGIISHLERDNFDRPIVTGTSMGTVPGDFNQYAKIETKNDVTYGVGSVLLLFSEASKITFE